MKCLLLFILGCVVGAVTHERDIEQACNKHGRSSLAGWTIAIECNAHQSTGDTNG